MGVNTFGYNGVFELRKGIVDKFLAQVYTRNLVRVGGKVSNDEFITIDLGVKDGQHVVVYVKIGVPTSSFAPAATTVNAIDLRVPVHVAVFSGPAPGAQAAGSGWSYFNQQLELGLDGLVMAEAESGADSVLRPNFQNLTTSQIKIFFPGLGTPLSDAVIDSILSATKVSLKASDLRAELLKQLKGGALKGIDIKVPSAGAKLESLKSWDLCLVSEKNSKVKATYDGLDLLLSKSETSGKGIPEDAGNTIPDGVDPPYGFALQMRGDIVLAFLESLLDRKGYYHQGVTSQSKNSKSDPYGYLTVSSTGKDLSYQLPPPPQGKESTVTLSAPKSGKVTLTIPKNGLNPRSRARLHNLVTQQHVGFEADSDGSATVTIAAEAGQNLGIEVYAASTPSNSKTVVWRPKFTLRDGKLRADFRAYQHIDYWCDADLDDCWVEVALLPDRSRPFKVTTKVIGKYIPLPWWAHVLGFLAELLTGGLVNGLIASILIETLGSKLLNDFVAEQLDAELKKQVSFPVVGADRLGLFLEKVDVCSDGLSFAGYADTGQIADYGRAELDVDPKGNLSIGSGYEGAWLWFDAGSSASRMKVTASWPVSLYGFSDVLGEFWSSGYEEAEKQKYGNTVLEVDPNKPALFWLKPPEALTKVLVEWLASDKKARVTWVSFKKRVVPEIKVVNRLTAKLVHQANLTIAVFECHTYDGWLELATQKFFRTSISRQAGFEKWYWNNQELVQDQLMTAPGVSFTWNTKTDRIEANINQTKLKKGLPQPPPGQGTVGLYVPEKHTIQYVGKDVFSLAMQADTTFSAPACSSRSLKLHYQLAEWRWPWGPDPHPWWMQRELGPIEEPHDLIKNALETTLHERLGDHPMLSRLADTMATALREGEAQLDAQTARLLLDIVGMEEEVR